MPEPSSCTSCGSAVSPGARFCPTCGADQAPTNPDAETVVMQGSMERLTADRLSEATTGEFEILRRIGHGAMGSVYLARDVALSRRVAIKVISPQLLLDESMVARFRLEAQTVAALRHPNIVNLYAVRQIGDLHFFIMDFIDGTTLGSLMKVHGPLDIDVTRALLFQIGSALNHAHERGAGVIHRDVKPGNVMIDRDGRAVVMDFGISKVGALRTGLTQTGATIGTPEYMSPEQCTDQDLSGASDQYALGIVAYEMLTGSVPFKGSTYAVMMAHVEATPPSIREQRPDCPPEVEADVTRMLAKAVAERFPDIDEAVAALRGAPLGRKDPVRDSIVAMVASVAAEAADIDESSPLSPTPPSRVPAPAAPAAPTVASPPAGGTEALAPAVPAAAVSAAPPTVAETSLPAASSRERRSGGAWWKVGLGVAALLVLTLGGLQAFGGLQLIGSGGGDAAGAPAGAAAVDLAALPATVTVGDTVELPARIVGADGEARAASVAEWTVGPERIATLLRPGVLVAHAEGPASIIVRFGDVLETVTVQVGPGGVVASNDPASGGGPDREPEPVRDDPPPEPRTGPAPTDPVPSPSEPAPALASRVAIRLADVDGALAAGTTSRIVATAFTEAGGALAGQAIAWTSSAPGVADVDGGVLRAVGGGSATIRAAAGEATESIEVLVLDIPTRDQVPELLRGFQGELLAADTARVRRLMGRGQANARQREILTWMRRGGIRDAQIADWRPPVASGSGAAVDFQLSIRRVDLDAGGQSQRAQPWLRALLEPSRDGWAIVGVERLTD